PRLLQSQVGGVRPATGGNEHLLSLELATVEAPSQLPAGPRDLLRPGAEMKDDPPSGHQLLEATRNVGVERRQQLIQHLDHSDLRTEQAEDAGKLHADHTAADHDQ